MEQGNHQKPKTHLQAYEKFAYFYKRENRQKRDFMNGKCSIFWDADVKNSIERKAMQLKMGI